FCFWRSKRSIQPSGGTKPFSVRRTSDYPAGNRPSHSFSLHFIRNSRVFVARPLPEQPHPAIIRPLPSAETRVHIAKGERMHRLYAFVASAVLVTSTLVSTALAADTIPMRDFFRNPEKTGFQISPDGKTISFLQPYENRL